MARKVSFLLQETIGWRCQLHSQYVLVLLKILAWLPWLEPATYQSVREMHVHARLRGAFCLLFLLLYHTDVSKEEFILLLALLNVYSVVLFVMVAMEAVADRLIHQAHTQRKS